MDKFGDTIRDILEQLVISPILIAWYTYQTAAANAGSLLGPGIIYGYFLISCLVCKSAISPLAPLIYAKERAEGDFRAKHLKLRENFEAIAALHGEHFEKREMSSVFQDLLSIEIVIIVKQMILKFITEFINNFGAALSYVVIAIPIFTGLLNDKSGAELSAIVSLNVFQSMYLIYRFTSITDMSQKISDLSGYTARIGYLLEVIENVDADEQVNVEIGSHKTCEIQQQHPETSPSPSFSDSIIIRDLALQIPKSSLLLFEKLDLKLDRFTNLVISGPNGAGKSTLLRAMAGLVTPSRGCINLPPFPQTMYLPQNVYMPSPSSLIDFLGYGCSGSIMHLPSTLDCTGKTEFTEDQALRALNKVGLENLVERFKKITAASGNHNEGSSLYHSFNMEEELSGGEKQRLHVARLILWKPTWAFIDEGFSGIDSAGRNRLLLELLKRDISLVVIMHDVEVPRANGVRWTHLRFPKTSGRAFVIEEIV